MKILLLAASLRKGSLNKKLAVLVASLLRERGCDLDWPEYSAFDSPAFNEDLENDAFPVGAGLLHKKLSEADAVILISPEYNFSMPGNLKNLIDWVSRRRPNPFRGKPLLLMAASPGPVGGLRGLWQLRIPLEGSGAHVYPDMFGLANADKMLADENQLADAKLQERLNTLLNSFLKTAAAINAVV